MISDVEFAEGLLHRINERREQIKNDLASGKLGESHDQVSLRYRELCGVLRGIEFVEDDIKEIIKQANSGGR